MRVQGVMFIGIAFCFAVADVIYWIFSKDPTGTTALALAVAMALLIGYYLLYTHRRVPKQELYEDDKEGEIVDGAGEIGFYSPHSWWPLALAGSCAVAFIGLPIGWWLVIIGGMLTMLSTVGWVYEYYRGEYKH
ncbi:MAG: cytochrome c oxidase subunit 4 [Streptosporangiales bacterium]|nr:cytochrome c oxidase subunit 4 [Streptosporangiales bacterium]